MQTVVIPDTGHWVAELAPEAVLAALGPFLAPYRDQNVAGDTSRAAVLTS